MVNKLNTAQMKAILHRLNPCVNAYLIAEAFARALRARITDWEREELARFEYMTDPKWVALGRPQRIIDPKQIHLLRKPDMWNMFAEERQHYIDLLKIPGLKHGDCPALLAEANQATAETILIQQAESIVPELEGLTPEKLLYAGRKTYHEMINVIVELTLNLPGYKEPKLPDVA